MKKYLILLMALVMFLLLAVPTYAYVLSPEEIYGEPDKGYNEGYEDGFKESGGRVVYKTREVSAKEYIADHETRFCELGITFLLVLVICVVPILLFRYVVCSGSVESDIALFISVAQGVIASVLITYIMYRIDYLVPCISIVVLWGIICKKVLES